MKEWMVLALAGLAAWLLYSNQPAPIPPVSKNVEPPQFLGPPIPAYPGSGSGTLIEPLGGGPTGPAAVMRIL